MTPPRFPRKHPNHGIKNQPSSARLAAEALFTASPAPASSDRPAARVIVKRRRALEIDRPLVVLDERRAEPPRERASKTHLLSIPTHRVVDATSQGQQQDLAPPRDGQPRRRRRTGRELNGEVTIIRPRKAERDAPSAVPARPLKRSTHSHTQPPGADHWPLSLRYPQLLARIRALEQEARDLQQRETTIRWVTQAIGRYRLTATDVGF